MIYGPYIATVLSIHDGDTLRVSIDLGFDLAMKTNVRFYGINAPELSTNEGKEALSYLQTLVAVGDQVSVLSYGWDKYGGRIDGAVITAAGTLGTLMVAAGHAVNKQY